MLAEVSLFLFCRLFDVDSETAILLWASLQRHAEGLWDVPGTVGLEDEAASDDVTEPWDESGDMQQPVSSWLKSIGMEHLSSMMTLEEVLTVDDLLTLIDDKEDLDTFDGVTEDDISQLWPLLQSLKGTGKKDIGLTDIGEWLRSHQSEHFELVFQTEAVNTLQDLHVIAKSFSDLTSFGMDSAAARHIWQALEQDRPHLDGDKKTSNVDDQSYQKQLENAEREEDNVQKIASALAAKPLDRNFNQLDTLNMWMSNIDFFQVSSISSGTPMLSVADTCCWVSETDVGIAAQRNVQMCDTEKGEQKRSDFCAR